jgi:hypothetical protein
MVGVIKDLAPICKILELSGELNLLHPIIVDQEGVMQLLISAMYGRMSNVTSYISTTQRLRALELWHLLWV